MSKKGFTLIELLAVIIIIGIIGLLVYPNISNVIDDSKETVYQNQVQVIEKSARNWGIKNTGLLSENEETCVNVSDLIRQGYIESEKVINPKDSDDSLDGSVIIAYDSAKKRRTYNYVSAKCEELE